MAEDKAQPLSGPDFRAGTKFSELTDHKPLLGHFDGEPAVLVRQGDQVFATGAICSHYGGPLAEGLVVGETIRCPWHHARFDLRTGEAIAAPALNSVSCSAVRRQGDLVMIAAKQAQDFRVSCPLNPSSVVIVGAGASGDRHQPFRPQCLAAQRTHTPLWGALAGHRGGATLASNRGR